MWRNQDISPRNAWRASTFTSDFQQEEALFMKRTLLTLALLTAAGAAGAQTVTPPAVPSRSLGAGGATVQTPSASGGTVQPPAARSGAVTTPGVSPPSASTPGAQVTLPSQANAPAAPNAQGSANAVKKIEADGYKNVQGMTRNRDGSWSGKALRGGAMVDVHVDARGNVITK